MRHDNRIRAAPQHASLATPLGHPRMGGERRPGRPPGGTEAVGPLFLAHPAASIHVQPAVGKFDHLALVGLVHRGRLAVCPRFPGIVAVDGIGKLPPPERDILLDARPGRNHQPSGMSTVTQLDPVPRTRPHPAPLLRQDTTGDVDRLGPRSPIISAAAPQHLLVVPGKQQPDRTGPVIGHQAGIADGV